MTSVTLANRHKVFDEIREEVAKENMPDKGAALKIINVIEYLIIRLEQIEAAAEKIERGMQHDREQA